MGNSIQTLSSNNNAYDNQYENSGYLNNSRESQNQFLSGFVELKSESTPTLGEYKVYQRQNRDYDELVLAKETQTDTEQQFVNLKNILNRRKEINSNHLAEFHSFFEKIESEWCSKFYRVWLVYEYSSLTLEKELWDRFKLGQSNQSEKVFL